MDFSNLNAAIAGGPLPEEIVISGLFGEHPEAIRQLLDSLLATVKIRHRDLAGRRLTQWDGRGTTVVVVPSSEALQDGGVADQVQLLARIGRKAGISLRLIDVLPPVFPAAQGELPTYPITVFGGSCVLREFAKDPDVTNVTYHQVTPAEMIGMAESA